MIKKLGGEVISSAQWDNIFYLSRIKKLGGEVISSAQWDNRCTHVIASSFVNYNAKVFNFKL